MRSISLLTTLLAALAMVLGLAACGEDEDAQEIIDRAFATPIESADVSLNVDLELQGGEAAEEPIRVQLTGPFVSGGREQIPSFDFDIALQGGGSEVPPLGLISTGDNVFVDIAGQPYEVGEEVVAQQNRQLAQQAEDEPRGFAALGVDPQRWIVDAEVEGEDEEVAGVPTTHVSAAIDVPALLDDLTEAAQRAEELGSAPAPMLDEEQQAELEEAIQDPTFDLFVDDQDRIRRLAAALTFEPPEERVEELGGVESGTLSFTIEFANVDGDQAQEIEAPQGAQPIAELAEQLGGLGGVLGGQPGAGSGSAAPVPEGGAAPAPEGGEAPGGSVDPQAFKEYGECLRQADPSDQAALEECGQLLEP